MKCKVCGNPVEYDRYCNGETMKHRQLCFTCNFWQDHVEHDKNPEKYIIPFVVNHEHYIADINPAKAHDYFKGFGGRKVEITFLKDGKTITCNNVWYQGKIPEKFWNLLPDTATIKWL